MSELLAELREWALITNVVAFLRVIRSGESSQDDIAYRTLYGGGTFESFRDHPRKAVTAGGYTSTAAGAYQFLSKTWDGLVHQYGFEDFGPRNQDLGAIALIKGRKALDAVIAGRLHEAIRLCGKEWASLPGSPYGQRTKTLAQCEAVYSQYGGTLAAVSVQEVKMPAPLIVAAAQAFLPELIKLIPFLSDKFGSGSEVATRNTAALSAVASAVVNATNQPNLQAAIEEMQRNPDAVKAATDAVVSIWPTITEAGGGGIEGARKAAAAPDSPPFWKQAPFAITVLLIPLVYLIVLASLGKFEWLGDITSETRAQVIGTVLGSIIGGIVGYFYGTSSGSQRKTDLLAK